MKTLRTLFAVAATMFSLTAAAADYTPVRCTSARPYEGPARWRVPPADAFDVQSSLDGALDAATVSRLEAALTEAMKHTGAPSATVAVSIPGRGTWSAERASTGAVPERFWWASVGKLVTAVTVLQLAQAGRVSLDDPIARYVDGVPNGASITLRHLLAHTSGLFSANEDQALRTRASAQPKTLAEELGVVRRHGAMFCPGQYWRYSNSGYALLGAVIEKIDGRAYSDAAQAHVLDAMGAGSLRMLSKGDTAADVAVAAPSKPDEAPVAIGDVGAAGGLVGRARDMNRLLQAILGSTLLPHEATRQQFAELYPMFGADTGTAYGLGVMAFEPAGSGIYWLGHAGGSPGVKAITAWSPRDHAFVSVALTGDGAAPAVANLLLKALAAPSPQPESNSRALPQPSTTGAVRREGN